MTKDELREEIRGQLLDRLDQEGTLGQFHLDLVEDYMALWDTKNALIEDVRRRGAVVPYTSNTGQVNEKKNESVGELLKVNGQMLKILESLGVKPGTAPDDDVL